jgi:hypothetical protein
MKDNYRQYLDLEEARALLAELNVILTPRQMKRAADLDAHGSASFRSSLIRSRGVSR